MSAANLAQALCRRGHRSRFIIQGVCTVCARLRPSGAVSADHEPVRVDHLKLSRPKRPSVKAQLEELARLIKQASDVPKHTAEVKVRSYTRASRERPKAKGTRGFISDERASRVNCRARLRGAEGVVTSADIHYRMLRQRGKCAYCRVCISWNFEIDHIIPLARGGSNWPRNIQLTCGPCNFAKLAKDPIKFAQSIGLLL